MATREQLIEDFADHKYATGEKFARLINSMKVVQEPVTDPAASGTSLSFIDSIEQDKDGKITPTKKTLDLSNAHELNPFKGWWKTGDTLPTSGFDGAYLYFKDTTQTPAVTTIYQWNGTAYANTGTVVDESNVQTFATGQAVNETYIDDTNLANPVHGSLVKAEDAKLLKDKLGDIQLEKVNVSLITSGANQNVFEGYIKCSSGENFRNYIYSNSIKTVFIPIVEGVKSIRFLGKEVNGRASTGYAFINAENISDIVATQSESPKDIVQYVINSQNWQNTGTEVTKEIVINKIPTNATYLCTVIGVNLIDESNFYCYYTIGESVADSIESLNGAIFGKADAMQYVFINRQINNQNLYVGVQEPNGGRFYNLDKNSNYKIKPQQGLSTIIAVLLDIYNTDIGATPAFSTKYPQRIVISSGEEFTFYNEDGNYLYMISQPGSSTYDIGDISTIPLKDRVNNIGGQVDSLNSQVEILDGQVSQLYEDVEYIKEQLEDSENDFIYDTGKLWNATDSLGKNIDQVTKVPATGTAYVFKIPISGGARITYPVFLSTGGYGSLIADKNNIVIGQYLNSTLETGTLSTITAPNNAAYFYFSAPNSLSVLDDYNLNIHQIKSGESQVVGSNSIVATVKWLPFLSSLTEESNNSLCLAAIKTRIVDNKIPFHSGFLFHKLPNDDGKVFYGTKLDNAVEVATLDYTPKDYVLAVSPEDGTIIGVVRDNRLPIRVYHNGQNYTVDAKSSDDNVSPKGWLYNSGVEFIKVNGTEYCIFAEYDGNITNNQVLHIWKGTYPYTSPSDWKTVLSKTTSYPVTNGTITHFHMIRRDPWTGILYCTTGDFTGQFFWLYSTDNGENWNTLATDFDNATKPSWALDGQPLRCINFVFTEDYIYFATDHGSNNTLSRIQRNSNTGVIDITTREILSELPYGVAVNTLCYVESPNGLFMFTRIDTGFTPEYSKPVQVLFWSFKNKQMFTVASLKQLTQNWGGHRGKCYMNYTNGQESRPAMGFAGNTPCQFDLIGANGANIGTIFYDL